MSYTITSQCIQCDRCRSLCPTGAIQRQGDRFWIEAGLCDRCTSSHSVPQCRAVCPTNAGCVPVVAPATPESDYWERWFDRYHHLAFQLKQAQQSAYWQRWFDTYAQTISGLS